jgi:hypothetical protein
MEHEKDYIHIYALTTLIMYVYEVLNAYTD